MPAAATKNTPTPNAVPTTPGAADKNIAAPNAGAPSATNPNNETATPVIDKAAAFGSPTPVTDNTSVILCIAESLVAQQKYCPEDIARKLTAWYESNPNPKNIGGTTREALTRLCEGVPFCHSGVREKPTNGSVMRCAPLSLIYCRNEEALIEASIEVSAITHSHAEAELSCVFINVMIAGLLLGASKKDAYLHAVEKTREIDRDFIKKYIGSSYNPEPRKGLAINTLLLAIGSFMPARSFEEAVVRAVNLGGNTNTTSAVTGALAGAYFGRQGIPRRWSTRLNPLPAKHFVKLGKMLFNMEPL
jgi:ADP-ribosyl-[dinitrogen reductase] hydrolase